MYMYKKCLKNFFIKNFNHNMEMSILIMPYMGFQVVA